MDSHSSRRTCQEYYISSTVLYQVQHCNVAENERFSPVFVKYCIVHTGTKRRSNKTMEYSIQIQEEYECNARNQVGQ